VIEDFPFSKEEVEKAIVELNPKFADVNIEALNKGYAAASSL
jgi:indolepyruvate ferredoxin oxidoreductase beta subunit